MSYETREEFERWRREFEASRRRYRRRVLWSEIVLWLAAFFVAVATVVCGFKWLVALEVFS